MYDIYIYIYCILKVCIDILWVWPPPNNSHNQDYYISCSGFLKA